VWKNAELSIEATTISRRWRGGNGSAGAEIAHTL
jgi:hypothetical protein